MTGDNKAEHVVMASYYFVLFLQDFWTVNSALQNTIILLVGQTVVALGGEFKLYLPRIVPQMLRVFMHDNSQGRVVTTKVRYIQIVMRLILILCFCISFFFFPSQLFSVSFLFYLTFLFLDFCQ